MTWSRNQFLFACDTRKWWCPMKYSFVTAISSTKVTLFSSHQMAVILVKGLFRNLEKKQHSRDQPCQCQKCHYNQKNGCHARTTRMIRLRKLARANTLLAQMKYSRTVTKVSPCALSYLAWKQDRLLPQILPSLDKQPCLSPYLYSAHKPRLYQKADKNRCAAKELDLGRERCQTTWDLGHDQKGYIRMF